MEHEVKRRKRELEDLKDQKRRYEDAEPKNYREKVYFAWKRLYSLDYRDREEFVSEVSTLSKMFTGFFLVLLLTVLSLKYLGFTGFLASLLISSLVIWLGFENERKLRSP